MYNPFPFLLLNRRELHSYTSSSSVMAPFFANHSCDPFAAENSPCTIGTYVRYAIDISEPRDIAVGIAFAKERNIRLVIRNTGHEYAQVFLLYLSSVSRSDADVLVTQAIWGSRLETERWLYGRTISRISNFWTMKARTTEEKPSKWVRVCRDLRHTLPQIRKG